MVADKDKRATTAQNISIKRNVLQLQKRSKSKTHENPKQIQHQKRAANEKTCCRKPKQGANAEMMQSQKHKPRKQMQQKNAAYPVNTVEVLRPPGGALSGTA